MDHIIRTMNYVPANPFAISGLAGDSRTWVPAEWATMVDAALSSGGSALVVSGPARMGKTAMVWAAVAGRRDAGDRVTAADLSTAVGPADGAARIHGSAQRALSGDAGPVGEPAAGTGTVRVLIDSLVAADVEATGRGVRLGIAVTGCERLVAWGGIRAAAELQTAADGLGSVRCLLVGSTPWRECRPPVPDRPAASLRCEPIEPAALADWICEDADSTGVPLDPAGVDAIVALAGPRTGDIVRLARAVWDAADAEGERATDPAGVERCLEQLVAEQAPLHARYWHALSPTAQRVLRTLAAAPRVALTSAAALLHHRLGPKSTVQLAARRLVDDGILVAVSPAGSIDAQSAAGVRERARYGFDDPFFRRWIERFVLGRGA